jgi:endonuclease YncB( thermonuclease family)
MIFRYCIVSFRLALLLLVGFVEASAQKAPSAKPFERLDACVLEPDEWTDGDSFRVRLPDGRLETFRLYFVDTTESRTRGKRSDEQAAYFGVTKAEAVKLGQEAKAFTAAALQRPFTIVTRWRPVFGCRVTVRSCLPQTATISRNCS